MESRLNRNHCKAKRELPQLKLVRAGKKKEEASGVERVWGGCILKNLRNYGTASEEGKLQSLRK